MDEIVDDIGPAPSEVELKSIRAAAKRLIDLNREIADLKQQLQIAEKKQKALATEELPNLMVEGGCTVIGVGNMLVEITPEFHARPYEDEKKRKEQFDWLVDNGAGGIIYRQLLLDMPKGDEVVERRVVEALEKLAEEIEVDLDPRIRPSMAWNTYQATLKQMMQNGVALPFEKLGAYIQRVATVTTRDKK
jgi:hypothetical protein